jgi:polar amino acid transport system substrate-binding protein
MENNHLRCGTFMPTLRTPAWLMLIAALCIDMAHAESISIRLGYSDAEAPPYQIRHDAQPPGIAMEIVRQAAADIGIELEFLRTPNRRVLENLKLGEIDGAFMFSFNTERMRNGQYPMKDGELDEEKRIAVLSYFLYRRKGADLHWDGHTLSGADQNIGANNGYSIVNDLRKIGVQVEEARTTEQNFNKLKLGRIAAVAHQDLVADPYLESADMQEVEKVYPPLSTKYYFLMLSHRFVAKHPELADRLWSRIAEIRESKTREVLPRYTDYMKSLELP